MITNRNLILLYSYCRRDIKIGVPTLNPQDGRAASPLLASLSSYNNRVPYYITARPYRNAWTMTDRTALQATRTVPNGTLIIDRAYGTDVGSPGRCLYEYCTG